MKIDIVSRKVHRKLAHCFSESLKNCRLTIFVKLTFIHGY